MRLRVIFAVVVGMLISHTVMMAQSDAPEVLDEFTIEPSSLTVTVTATGVIDPLRSVDLDFEISAPIDEVMVREGDSVRRGDVLARLEADDLNAALREAEIALELQQLVLQSLTDPPRDVDVTAAEASVEAAEAQINSAGFGPTPEQIEIARYQAEIARNQLWQAQLNRDIVFDLPREFRGGRPRELQLLGAIEQADIGVNVANANIEATIRSGGGIGAIASAEAQLVQAQIALERLLDGPDEVDLILAEIQLDQAALAVEQARNEVERALLEAPFDGVVAESNLVVGEIPPVQQLDVQLIDDSEYYVDLAIDESDVVNVDIGQAVSLRLDALPEADIAGVITRISLIPDPSSTVVVYSARVTLDPTSEPIRVGMSTTATITTRELNDALVLPNRFVRIDRDTQQAFVTVARDGRFVEVPVVLGERNASVSQILSGLQVGERVVQLRRDTLGLNEVLDGPGN